MTKEFKDIKASAIKSFVDSIPFKDSPVYEFKVTADKSLAVAQKAKDDSFNEPCLDNVVLTAELSRGAWTVGKEFQREKLTERNPSDDRKMIHIILESPHVDEFKHQPAIPAAGATGRNIIQCLEVALSNHSPNTIQDGVYSITLVNAIQHQASLGVKPIYFRDAIFREMWKSGYRELFKARLLNYLAKGDIIINACTCGKTTSKQLKLREDVQVTIDAALGTLPFSIPLIRFEHPSVWGRILNTANKYGTEANFLWKAESKAYKKLS
ncbi:hypothetical protein QX249_12925 [Vibrio parahaemolyticus]|uniref:Uncharacterized protein n=1 Tax=Vibrio parahaemolyticus TaxID=670 RepID=A0AAW8Q1N3_VIBPH|nr:hypothetical protein [Vibrio parahaemolyticus]MDS1821569.1 hypothetical protein [Vibrio parahaemolyticus]